uniref:Uncharacterized protein n=1 Tax=Arundo donax TaxID=35708 RepID=A0A0A8YZ64_ARUDO
MKRPRCKTYGA